VFNGRSTSSSWETSNTASTVWHKGLGAYPASQRRTQEG